MEPDSWFAWQPEDFYQPSEGCVYAVVILNQALDKHSVGHVQYLWQNACVRVCVDGGTNDYHDLMFEGGNNTQPSPPHQPVAHPSNTGTSNGAKVNGLPHPCAVPSSAMPLPDFISGDLDSIRSDVLRFYATLNVKIMQTPDQDETDFTKSIRVLAEYVEEHGIELHHILVVAGVKSSRFDHVMAHLATLFKVKSLTSIPVILLSGRSLIWLLEGGKHKIQVPRLMLESSKAGWCGLIPIGHSAVVTTTGLKWNLDNQKLAFGKLVSTSNTYDMPLNGSVTISTSHPILWTMGWTRDTAGQESEEKG